MRENLKTTIEQNKHGASVPVPPPPPVVRVGGCPIFRSAKGKFKESVINRFEVYEMVKSDAFKKVTSTIQQKHQVGILDGWETINKNDYQDDKLSSLKAVGFSWNGYRGAKFDGAHNGVICLDIDENTPEELNSLLDKIKVGKVPFIEAAAFSVSGIYNGSFWANIKIEIPSSIGAIPPTLRTFLNITKADSRAQWVEKLHNGYYKGLTFIFAEKGIKIGKSSHLSHPRYLTHDANIYVNADSQKYKLKALDLIFKKLKKEGQNLSNDSASVAAINETDGFKFCEAYAQSKGFEFVPNSRHYYRVHCCIAANLLGISRDDIVNFLVLKYGEGLGINQWATPHYLYSDNFGKWSHLLQQQPKKTWILEGKAKFSSICPEFLPLLLKHKKIDFDGGCGLGKNYGIVHHLAPELKKINGCTSVIILPNNAKVEKDGAQYGIEVVTAAQIKNFTTSTLFREATAKQPLIICNQNSFNFISDYFKSKNQKINTFLDEAHLLAKSKYKGEMLAQMWEAIESISENIVTFSGSPVPYFETLGFTRLKATNKDRRKINFIFKTRDKSVIQTAIQHIKNSDLSNGKKVLIQIQSKKKLQKLQKLLITKYGFSKNQIVRLVSDPYVKKSADYKRFKNAKQGEESFRDSVKIILVTSYINEGVDVYSEHKIDFMNIEREKSFDTDNAVQFPDRWRTDENGTCYSYHPEGIKKKVYNYNRNSHFKNELKKWNRWCELENNNIQTMQSEGFGIKSIYTTYDHHSRYIFWSSADKCFKVDKVALMQDCETRFIKSMDTSAAIERIKQNFDYINVIDERETIVTVSKEDKANVKAIIKESNADTKEAYRIIRNLFREDKTTFFETMRSNTPDVKIRSKIKKERIEKGILQTYWSKNLNIFQNHFSECEKFTHRVIEMQDLFFEKDEILNIIFDEKDEFLYHSKYSNIIQKLKVQIGSYLFEKEKNVNTARIKKMSLPQKYDIRERRILAKILLKKFSENENKISISESTQFVIDYYSRRRTRRIFMTADKSRKLLNSLIKVEKVKTENVMHYVCIGGINLDVVLSEFFDSFDDVPKRVQTYIEKVHNSLIIS